eukprot:490054-Karenia_brevis.AAC.1
MTSSPQPATLHLQSPAPSLQPSGPQPPAFSHQQSSALSHRYPSVISIHHLIISHQASIKIHHSSVVVYMLCAVVTY